MTLEWRGNRNLEQIELPSGQLGSLKPDTRSVAAQALNASFGAVSHPRGLLG